ncbi:MAG: peroxide stress protein YaaA [Clostridiaceae bacterium]|nr:peroxide stress protein YaaA [Clostridiaceae bacterium]
MKVFLSPAKNMRAAAAALPDMTAPRYLQTGDRMVTCEFLTYRKGKLRCLPTMAKMARGRMTRYILQNRIESPEQLTLFDWNDFRYEQSLSDNHTLTFIVSV